MPILALIAAAAATGGPITEPAAVQLDADPALERLVPAVFEDEYGYEQRRVVLVDGCGSFRLLPAHDVIGLMEGREIDGRTARREALVEGRSGASGRAGTTKVVRLDGCRPRTLFSYASARPPHRPPRGWYVTTYGVRPKRGEIRVTEYLARNDEPAVAASRQRISRWRYDGRRGRFTRRSSRVSPVR